MAGWHDGPIRVIASTVAEAIELITRQIKQFQPTPQRGRQIIKVVGYEQVEDLYRTLTEAVSIDVVNDFRGGKNGGFLQILIGSALVAAGTAAFFATGGTFAAFLAGPGGFLLKIGAMMLLGGLVQLLSPAPDNNDSNKRTRYLGAPKNTVAIGTPIPVLYGEDRVYGHYLSYDINAEIGKR